MLSSNIEEIFQLQNHNKTLITKIKKLKHSIKREQSSEGLKGRTLDKLEENQCLKNHNQEPENQINKSEIDKNSQDERFRKIHNHNNLQENQEAQIKED